ncbi:MAG: hypothetical protein WB420_19840 [Bradyrhizobium sp.]
MAKDSSKPAGSFGTEETGGLLSGFLAEEDEFDRRTLWRLGSWAAASVGAVIIAILANQSSLGMRREQIASADLARQSQQIQSVAKESQGEARRLAAAIETLNGDRDRLYSRVSVLEQGLDSVTGAIARQNSAVTSPQAATPAASPAPAVAPVAALPAEAPAMAQKQPATPVVSPVAATAAVTAEKPVTVATAAAEPGPAPASSAVHDAAKVPAETPATPLTAAKSMMAPPDPAAAKLIEPGASPKTVTAAPMPEVVAATSPAEAAEPETAAATPALAVQRTEFGVDVGGANSLPGLRALWRGLLKSRSNAALTKLRPIVVIKEGTGGLGMQLRLVAGPISDAAAAAKICAAMTESDRNCATTVFEGQRLAVNADEPAAGAKPQAAEIKPAAAAKPAARKHYAPRRAAKDPEVPKPEPSALSRLFGTR